MNTFIRQKAEETDRQADKQTNKQYNYRHYTVHRTSGSKWIGSIVIY